MDNQHIEVTTPWYREGTVTTPKRANFVLNYGGIGDYICWLTSLTWVAKYHSHILGYVYAPKFFLPIVEHVFKPYPRFKIYDKKELTDEAVKDYPTYIPTDKHTLNCTGSNLIDLGFAYYTNKMPAPEYHRNYEKLRVEDLPHLNHERFNQFTDMAKKYRYAVLTPYYTHENRRMPAKVFNRIKAHLISKKIVPVLIGQEAWAERKVSMDNEFDFHGCIDLLNKTTLLEAARVISHAVMVIGVDNGLLHLAGMTDIPIVYGYTIVPPELREPRRSVGITINVLPAEEVSCRYCMSRMRFQFNHDFNFCIYKDNACVESLNDFNPWEKAINRIIEVTSGPKEK